MDGKFTEENNLLGTQSIFFIYRDNCLLDQVSVKRELCCKLHGRSQTTESAAILKCKHLNLINKRGEKKQRQKY